MSLDDDDFDDFDPVEDEPFGPGFNDCPDDDYDNSDGDLVAIDSSKMLAELESRYQAELTRESGVTTEFDPPHLPSDSPPNSS